MYYFFYWYFLDKGFRCQQPLCNGYHDILMSYDINNIATLNFHGVYYRCIILEVSKCETITVIENFVLDNKEWL